MAQANWFNISSFVRSDLQALNRWCGLWFLLALGVVDLPRAYFAPRGYYAGKRHLGNKAHVTFKR